MVIPQAAYAQQDERNPSSLSSDVDNCASDERPASINGRMQCIRQGESSDVDNCASDERPASINGRMQCIRQGECYSEEFEFDGEQVRHCNFMMSSN
jgi:hypothetical protein